MDHPNNIADSRDLDQAAEPRPQPAQSQACERAKQATAKLVQHALLVTATRLAAEQDSLRDLMAMPMRTMLSPLALQMLRMLVYTKKGAHSAAFDCILQFLENNEIQNRGNLYNPVR
jgi:hypothetical protein